MSLTVATIEARMSSSRLPGKVLAPILGRPMLELLIERVQRAALLDGIVVATTTNPADDAIAQLAQHLGIGCYRGSESDVLARVLEAAETFSADVIVELTGDNPVIDPAVIDLVVKRYREWGCDYVSNTLQRTFPLGLDTQVFATEVLRRVATLTDNPSDREHVSIYIYSHPEEFTLCNVTSDLPADAAQLRLTVDSIEDLERVRRIYEQLYPASPEFTTEDVLREVARGAVGLT
jgi:spore coat polysaccharide biosynthesis protein SpsF